MNCELRTHCLLCAPRTESITSTLGQFTIHNLLFTIHYSELPFSLTPETRHLTPGPWHLTPALPIDYRAIIHVVTLGVPPIVTDLIRHRLFVQLDSKSGAGGNVDVPVLNFERVLDVSITQ